MLVERRREAWYDQPAGKNRFFGGVPMNSRSTCLMLALLLVLGCRQEATHQATPDQLKGRLDAAMAMTNVADKCDALAAIAKDAVDANEGEIVKKALDQMTNVAQKNDAAYACALKLSDRGDSQRATEVAKMITNVSQRNEALSKIAKGNN